MDLPRVRVVRGGVEPLTDRRWIESRIAASRQGESQAGAGGAQLRRAITQNLRDRSQPGDDRAAGIIERLVPRLAPDVT